MKVDTIETMQHANMILLLIFCVLYPFCYLSTYHIRYGVIIWILALPMLYFPNLISISGVSGEEMKDAKKISPLWGWVFVLWWLADLGESNLLKIASFVFLALLIILGIFLVRKWRRIVLTEKRT